jgi:hypothetical protein
VPFVVFVDGVHYVLLGFETEAAAIAATSSGVSVVCMWAARSLAEVHAMSASPSITGSPGSYNGLRNGIKKVIMGIFTPQNTRKTLKLTHA